MNSRLLVGVPVLAILVAVLYFYTSDPRLLARLSDASRPGRPSSTTLAHAPTVGLDTNFDSNSNSDPVPLPSSSSSPSPVPVVVPSLPSPSPLLLEQQPSQPQDDISSTQSQTETEASPLPVDSISTLALDLQLTPQPTTTSTDDPSTLDTQTETNIDTDTGNDDYTTATVATVAADVPPSLSPEPWSSPDASSDPPFVLTHDVSVLQHPLVAHEDCRSRTRVELPPLLAPPPSMPSALADYAHYHRMARTCIDALLATEPPTSTSSRRRPPRVPSVCAAAAAAAVSRDDNGGSGRRPDKDSWTSSLPPVMVFATDRGRSGGLGDRIRSLRNILMLSLLTRRVFLLEWQQPTSNPYALTSAVHPSYVDWDLNETSLERLRHWYDAEYDLNRGPEGLGLGAGSAIVRLFPNVESYKSFNNPVNESEGLVDATETDFDVLFKPFSLIVIYNSVLPQAVAHALARNIPGKERKRTEGLSSMTLLQLERTLTDFLFRPSPIVDFLAARRTFGEGEEEKEGENMKPYVAVHARTGDDVWEAHDGRFTGLAGQFHTVSQRLLTCVARTTSSSSSTSSDATTRVFLASDSLALKYIMADTAAQAGVQFNTNRRYAWHIDKMVNVHFETQLDNCVGFLEVFADAFALARAHTVIFSPSNFPGVSMGFGGARVRDWFIIDQRQDLREDDCMPATAASQWNDTESSRAFVRFDAVVPKS